MDLSVIIVNWNTRELLDACLASVLATSGLDMEVYVVDNASTDGSPAMVRERYPQVKLIENAENRGFAAANNQAIALAQGRYVLLLNSDATLSQGSANALVRFADATPCAGIVGCRLENPDGTFQAGPNALPTLWSSLLEAWGLAALLYRNPYYPSAQPERSASTQRVGWVGGACLLVRQQAIAEVGMLDEGYPMNSEEVDWCWRMQRSGWEVWYHAEARVTHLGGASASRRSALQYKRLYGGKIRFITMRHGRLAGAFLAVNYRLAQLVRALCWRVRACLKPSSTNTERARVFWEVATARSWP